MSEKTIKGLGGLWEGWLYAARLNLEQIDQKDLKLKGNYQDITALGRVLKKANKGLYRGKPGLTLGPNELQAIQDQLKKKTTAIRYKRRIKLLIRGIEQGNKEGRWTIAPPSSVQLYSRDRSPFNTENMLQLYALRPVIKRFESSLEQTRDLSPPQRIGQILASALINGGLLRGTALAALLTLMPDQCFSNRHDVWVDLPAESWGKRKNKKGLEPSKQIRRWIADPLTAILILLSFEDGIWSRYRESMRNGSPNKKPWTLIKDFFNVFPDHQENRKLPFKSLSGLIKACRINMALSLRPFLLDYACGKIESYSLPPARWLSAAENRKTQIPHETDIDDNVDIGSQIHADRSPQISGTNTSQRNLYHMVIREIVRSDKTNKRKAIIQRIKDILTAHESEFFPLMFAFTHWVISVLRRKRDAKNYLAVRSVYKYVTSLTENFSIRIPNRPIDQITIDEYLSLYRAILEIPARSAATRSAALRQIRIFHQFIVAHFGAPLISDDEWRDDFGNIADISANLVTSREYQNARSLLHGSLTDPLASACEVILILGYRCGLRRSECKSLRLSDIRVDGEKPYISVEAFWLNRLKSADSRRRIYLEPLLSSDELRLLKKWKKSRIAEANSPVHGLLFPDPKDPDRPIPDAHVFNPIKRALRDASGDPSVSFHTLRHSFANNALLLLLGIDPSSELKLKGFTRKTNQQANFARTILIGVNRTECPTNYALSTEMGHASPKTTLKNYVHILDLVLANDLKRASKPLPINVVHKILGHTKSGLYRFTQAPNKNEVQTGRLVEALLRSHSRRRPYPEMCDSSRVVTQVGTVPRSSKETLSPQALWAIVSSILTRCPTLVSVDEAPRDVPRKQAQLACNAIEIAKISNRRGNARHLTVPNKPLYKADRIDCAKYWANLMRLNDKGEKLALWAVNQFLNTTSLQKYDARLNGVGNAYRYCRFLMAIGVPKNRIKIAHHPNPASYLPCKEQILKWRSGRMGAFKIRPEYKVAIKGRNAMYGSVGIKVVQGPTKGKPHPPWVSYGFRYALHAWAVLHFQDLDRP